MNDRQRLLMQKIVEYGDVKLQWGMNLQRLGRAYGDVEKSSELLDKITRMVTEWVSVSQEGPSDESSSDLRVVVPQNVTEPYSNKDVTTNVTTRKGASDEQVHDKS